MSGPSRKHDHLTVSPDEESVDFASALLGPNGELVESVGPALSGELEYSFVGNDGLEFQPTTETPCLQLDRVFFVDYNNCAMQIFIGSDHGGFAQKEQLTQLLTAQGFSVTDCGTYTTDSTDYPDFALAVCQAVIKQPRTKGILLCRSGEGMEMAANKVKGIRAALVWEEKVAQETRRDNDANVLVLPSDFISSQDTEKITNAFLHTEFSGEDRHIRRLEKLHHIEHTQYAP